MQNAVIYARYSSDNQREESITAQVRAIKSWAIKEDYNIVDIYKDEALTATTDDRQDFLRMIEDSSKGHFKAVLVHKLDRFARNRYDSAFYKRQLKLNGVRVISILELLDDSPESIILESVLEGMAEYYSANLSREVRKGHKENALLAKHNGGSPPLGYDLDEDKTLKINSHEATAVNIIFNMYANGYTYMQIIKELNSNGFKTKVGRPFGKGSLHEILKQEKYKGIYVYNRRTRGPDGKYGLNKNKDSIIKIDGGCPKIVSKELWDRVRLRRDENRRTGGRLSAKVDYLLTGKIFCGKCGAALTGHGTSDSKTKAKYYYYVCNNKKRTGQCDLKGVKKEEIEEIVIKYLDDNVFGKETIEGSIDKVYEYVLSKTDTIPGQLDKYKKDLSKIEKEIEEALDLLLSGYRHQSLKDRMDKLEEEKQALVNLVIRKELELDKASYNRDDISKFMYMFTNIKNMDAKAQRRVIEIFVHRITIYEDTYKMSIFTNPLDKEKFVPQTVKPHPDHSRYKEGIETITLWTK